MKTIYKYNLTMGFINVMKLPKNASVISVQVQNNKPILWAMVETENELEDRVFIMLTTGSSIGEQVDGHLEHLGTVQLEDEYDGSIFVGHYFEVIKNKF